MHTTHHASPPKHRAQSLLLFLLLWTCASIIPVAASAQETPKGDSAQKEKSNSVGFKAAGDDLPKENLPGWPFLYGAYAMLWFLPIAYVAFLWNKQAALKTRLAELDKRLDQIDRVAEQAQKNM